MVHYKLTYFDLRGWAEVSRQLFALAGVEYEDDRIEYGNEEVWGKIKPTTPFGQIPVLEVDGFKIPQSAAIARYLARKFGYAGKTPEEEAWVDALVDQYKDYMNTFRQHMIAAYFKKPAEEIERIRKETSVPAAEGLLKLIKSRLAKNKTGFLVGGSVTFADLTIVDHLFLLQKHDFYKPADEPELTEYERRVNSLPGLKEWLEKRPDTVY